MTNVRSSKNALQPLLSEVFTLTTCTTGRPQEGSDSCPEGSCLCQDPSAHLKGEDCSNMSSATQLKPHHAHQQQHKGLIPPLLEANISSMDEASLREFVAPISHALKNLEAEELLDLDRADIGGAQLRDGVCVHPIHDKITPPRHEIRNGSCVRYLHVAEKEGHYSIGIFVFPPHAKMPLHDHPEMVVLSRVLYGDLEKKSLDLERPQPQPRPSWLGYLRSSFRGIGVPSNAKRAYKVDTEHLQAPATTMLFPYEGNLHQFQAGPNGAAVLDVLLPPYGDARDCTFYDTTDDDQDPRACWIVPTGQPEDFHCISGEYLHLGKEDEEVAYIE